MHLQNIPSCKVCRNGSCDFDADQTSLTYINIFNFKNHIKCFMLYITRKREKLLTYNYFTIIFNKNWNFDQFKSFLHFFVQL